MLCVVVEVFFLKIDWHFCSPSLMYILLFLKICDAVAVAKVLNATLIIPYLEVNPVWQDSRYLLISSSVHYGIVLFIFV